MLRCRGRQRRPGNAPQELPMATNLAPVSINPASLPKPSGYSHGTLSGNTLYLGGQTALDQDMKIVSGGPRRHEPGPSARRVTPRDSADPSPGGRRVGGGVSAPARAAVVTQQLLGDEIPGAAAETGAGVRRGADVPQPGHRRRVTG